jgi:beta-glucosidase
MDTQDRQKIDVLSGFWEQAWLAMTVYGVDLRGIFVWSFLDNLEWDCGYACHFGVVHVNHTRQDLQRTPKQSAYWYRDVILAHGFPAPANSSFAAWGQNGGEKALE